MAPELHISIQEAHKHCSFHRSDIMDSVMCACFYCYEYFIPKEIFQWIHEKNGIGQTALCPFCSIDAVLGDKSGYSLDIVFLKRMHDYWFSKNTCIALFSFDNIKHKYIGKFLG
jgi:hypothetical protein